MVIKVELNGGLDIGNGYVKALVEDRSRANSKDMIDMPSAVTILTRPNQIPIKDEDAIEALSEVTPDFYNQLDASFDTPLIPDSYRRVFGMRSLSAEGAFEEFDTVGRASKAKQPLAKALVLGIFAAKALKDYVIENNELPTEELLVDVSAALALPISEFMRHRESYAAEFTNGGKAHIVMIKNFETSIVVKLVFSKVEVMAEGASAHYAIAEKGASIMGKVLEDLKNNAESPERLEELSEITPEDILAATNTIGIDVGEGTVNFPVFTNGKFNADASRTLDKGWGSVLMNAITAMEDQGIEAGFSSRKELAEFLQRKPSALKKAFHARVQQFVDQEAVFFADEVAEKLGSILRNVGAMNEVGFVYGGGARSMKDVLYPRLLAKISEMNTMSAFPLLYLDGSYARHLNRAGLFLASKDKENAKAKAKTEAPAKRKTKADAETENEDS